MTNKLALLHNLSNHTKIFNTGQMTPLKHTNKRGNMERILSTRNLHCCREENNEGKWRYTIFEKATETPVISFTKKGLVHVYKAIDTLDIKDYKYYNQVVEIVKEVLKMEGGAK